VGVEQRQVQQGEDPGDQRGGTRPRGRAGQRRNQADRCGLGEHRGQDLAAGGAQRAGQRELAGALGDRDGERVGDQRAAHQQGYQRESDQEELLERQRGGDG
jgi:hypothetical protein